MEPTIGPQGYPTWDKDPQAVKDYTLNWSLWLGADTIVTSVWDMPPGITKDSSGNTDVLTTVWLSGGTPGKTYLLTNKITTAAGRTEPRTIEIQVKKQ